MFDDISAEAEAGAVIESPTSPSTSRQKSAKANIGAEANHPSPSSNRSRKGGKARSRTTTEMEAPSRDIPQASTSSQPNSLAPAETELSGQRERETQSTGAAQPHSVGQVTGDNQASRADQTELPGRARHETQSPPARRTDTGTSQRRCANQQSVASVGSQDTSQGRHALDNQSMHALVGEIKAVYRRYEDLRRARQRIELQAMATCRNACGGDKKEGMKLYKSPTPEVEAWLLPYFLAMEPLDEAIKENEKLLAKLGRKLPVSEWADTVPGLSPRFLAAIVGECGIGPGEFRSVSALWKRMGMAVINGERQRRVTGDAAIEHGYVPRRRSLMWNIGEQVAVRQGIRNPKDEEGNPTGAVPNTEWGALYLERKAYLTAKNDAGDYKDRKGAKDGKLSAMHIHNDAKRYVEKRLLRELWKAWRRASQSVDAIDPPPAATEAHDRITKRYPKVMARLAG